MYIAVDGLPVDLRETGCNNGPNEAENTPEMGFDKGPNEAENTFGMGFDKGPNEAEYTPEMGFDNGQNSKTSLENEAYWTEIPKEVPPNSTPEGGGLVENSRIIPESGFPRII
jgi:hypothetical protein